MVIIEAPEKPTRTGEQRGSLRENQNRLSLWLTSKTKPNVQLPLLLILVSYAIRMSKTCPEQSMQCMH